MVTFEAKMRPATVIGDAERLRTIIDNLISNAIKFSPRNATIELGVGIKDGFAVLDVIDEGRGVAPDDRSRIFESFYQGPPPLEGRVKGSGLGLAIAREYALAQGGRIEVAGRGDGKSGAWFRLSLPIATAAAARRGTPAVVLASGR
jgi:two-component system sensor histidine kinase GlrK